MIDQQLLQEIAEITSELRCSESTLMGIENALNSLEIAVYGLLILGCLFLVAYCLKGIGRRRDKGSKK